MSSTDDAQARGSGRRMVALLIGGLVAAAIAWLMLHRTTERSTAGRAAATAGTTHPLDAGTR